MSKFSKEATALVQRYNYDTTAGGADEDLSFSQLIERLEQLAADTYSHPTEPGWCCACEADIAFAESWLRETKPEIFK